MHSTQIDSLPISQCLTVTEPCKSINIKKPQYKNAEFTQKRRKTRYNYNNNNNVFEIELFWLHQRNKFIVFFYHGILLLLLALSLQNIKKI